MSLNFNKYVQDAEQFLREVAEETGSPGDVARGHRILRAVLHTLRNRVPPAESLQLISQLPMFIKAVYVDGWKMKDDSALLRTPGDFIEAVREAGGPGVHDDFTTDREVERAIQAVFRVLERHVSAGEIRDVLATLPAGIKLLLGVKTTAL